MSTAALKGATLRRAVSKDPEKKLEHDGVSDPFATSFTFWVVTEPALANKNNGGGASFPGGAPGLQNR